MPPSVRTFLEDFRRTRDYEDLRAEFEYLREYRARWDGAPFPPVFVTTDAVVIRSGHVLLVRRGGQPGRGRLAMPGGFLAPKSTLLDSCVRRLREETGLPEGLDLAGALRGSDVFDYPDRSQRGRTITHAFHFDLGLGQLPILRPGGDSAGAEWTALSDALARPELFFEDHHAIVERFLMKR